MLDSCPMLRSKSNIKVQKMEHRIKRLLADVISGNVSKRLCFYWLSGNLLKALKQGDWVLLDELNLASDEILQRLCSLLDPSPSFLYCEHGGIRQIARHQNFRLLGCMNPGGQVGKKWLPERMRRKWTEIWVESKWAQSDVQQFIQNKMAIGGTGQQD